MCLTKSTRVGQLIVKQTGCLPFVQIAPKCVPFPQDATKGDNGHFRPLRAITYEKILNKSNAIFVCICLRLLVWNAGRLHVKKYHLQKSAPPRPPPMTDEQ